MDIRSPALFAYVFCAIDGDRTAFDEAWAAAGRLGITEPIEGISVGPAVGDVPAEPVPEFVLLAAARRAEQEGQYQAYAFAYHDVTGVVVCLAPEEGDASTWQELLEVWSAASAGEGSLGSATALVGLAERDAAAGEPPPVRGRSWASGTRTDARIAVWEASGDPRLLALVAPQDREEAVDRWAWWAGETRLPALGLALLHAAKLRYESGVYRTQIAGVHGALRELDDEIAAMTGVLAGEHGGPLPVDRLREAQHRLVRMELRLAALTGSSTSLADLGRTVAIARHNLEALLPAPAPAGGGESSGDSPFARDLQVADWLEAQVAHDVGYASSTRERADRVRDLVALRLSQATERRMERQNDLLLIQAALFSALLAGLTAFSVIRQGSGVDDGLEGPLVAVAAALGVALPVLFAHWHDRYGWFDRLVAGLLGAGLGWLAATLLWWNHGAGAGPWLSILLAVLGSAIAVGVTLVRDRALQRAHGDRAPPAA